MRVLFFVMEVYNEVSFVEIQIQAGWPSQYSAIVRPATNAPSLSLARNEKGSQPPQVGT